MKMLVVAACGVRPAVTSQRRILSAVLLARRGRAAFKMAWLLVMALSAQLLSGAAGLFMVDIRIHHHLLLMANMENRNQ
jgi:hypothetical protein